MTRPILPAEWHPQAAVQLTWPHANGDWGEHIPAATACFAEIARVISQYQTVFIVLADILEEGTIRQLINSDKPEHLQFARCPNRDVWARDHAPITTLATVATLTGDNNNNNNNNNAIAKPSLATLHNFQFNGWGGKFPAELDNQITPTLYAASWFGDADLVSHPITLEGGAIETDGCGTLLASKTSIINPNRNPNLTQFQIENILQESLGLTRFLWLEHGTLEGDDTDNHIDTIARFAAPDTIVYQGCQDHNDSHYAELQAMGDELRSLQQANGQPYQLLELPLPPAQYAADGTRLPAGYANFLIINRAVLVPTYAVATDAIALTVLSKAFPQHKVIGINCQALIQQYGSLHCVTMQYPQADNLFFNHQL